MTLQNVPEILDRKSTWLREEENRDLLRKFLYDYGVSIDNTYKIKFEEKQMTVYRYDDKEGKRQLNVRTREARVQTPLVLEYLPGKAPTLEN